VCFESIGLSQSDDSLSFGTATGEGEEGDVRGASKGGTRSGPSEATRSASMGAVRTALADAHLEDSKSASDDFSESSESSESPQAGPAVASTSAALQRRFEKRARKAELERREVRKPQRKQAQRNAVAVQDASDEPEMDNATLNAVVVALRQEMAELKAAQGAAQPVRPDDTHVRPRVTPKDVKLPMFSGNDDPDASIISRSRFDALYQWLESAELKLRTSELPPSQWNSVLLNHLTGAANATFLRVHGASAVHAWTFEQCREHILQLVPESKVHFADMAIAMRFRADALCEGIERFARAVHMSELPADSAWLYDKLIRKITAVSPMAFETLRTRFNVSISKCETFKETVKQLHDGISMLQVNDLTGGRQSAGTETPWKDVVSKTRNKRAGSVRDGASDKRPRPEGGRRSDDDRRRSDGDRSRQPSGPVSEQQRERQEEWRRLAQRFNRCFRCGMHVPDLVKHKAGECRPDPQAFARRMGVVKSLIDKGLEDKVNNFSSRDKK
jgi:hypothetical protein